MTGSGVAAVVKPSAAITAAITSVEVTSMARNPNRLISGVVAGLMPTLPAKMNSTIAPDFTGDQPNSVCHSSGSRNGAAPTTSQYRDPPNSLTRNVSVRRVRRFSSGCSARRRCHTDPASSSAEATAKPAVSAAGTPPDDTRCAV